VNENATERRPQSQRARWLVGESYNGKQRLGHRRRDPKMARSSSKTKWIQQAFISYSRIRSSRFTNQPTAILRWPGSSSCANRSAASRPSSYSSHGQGIPPSGFTRPRRRLTATFRKTSGAAASDLSSGNRVFAKIGHRFGLMMSRSGIRSTKHSRGRIARSERARPSRRGRSATCPGRGLSR